MSSFSDRKIYVVGGHISDFTGKGCKGFVKGERDIKSYVNEAVQGALGASGVTSDAVDRVYVGNFAGELFNQQGHLGSTVAGADPGLMNKPSMRLEAACASGGLACSEAVRAIRAGDDCVLAVGVEVQTEADARTGGTYLARASDFKRQSSIDDFTFPALFGRRTKAYLEKYPDVSMDSIADVAAKAFANGNRNPKAHMHAKVLSPEDARNGPKFLSNEEYKPYLRVTDCSQVSDGGAAAVFMSAEGMKKHGIPLENAVEVLGSDQGAGNLWEDPSVATELSTTKEVVGRMMNKAGVKPSDLQVAEVHDCFAVTELMMYEAIGLAEPGKGHELFKSGATGIEGSIPVNTGGGLVAFGHPVGATGVKQIMEVYRQMKGQCGDYQMPKKPELGITVNMGGDDKTAAAMLLKNVTGPVAKL